MKIVAADLSISATGIARRDGSVITVGGKPVLGDQRLILIEDALIEALGLWHDEDDSWADLLVVEGPVARSATAYISGQLHGIMKRLCLRSGMPFVIIPPATLKAYATGKGNADKTQMAIAALKRADREFQDDNQCDASWLRWAALDHYGYPEFPMPKIQQDRLNKVQWPTLTKG
jgi:Holliday junction resolvasome RuvABC endonuclease subunit